MARSSQNTRNGYWILLTCILASSLSFIDGSVVNVGLPAIARSLAGKAADLQWVINGYLLPLGALLLLGGAAGDRYGRKPLLILGTVAFALASLGCALAGDLAFLLAARVLQGIGAAILLPNSLATLGASFDGEAKGRAVGIWAAAGAVLGGWLIDTVGWRAIFLINLPPAFGAIVLALISLPEAPRDKSADRLDWLGGLLVTAALGCMTWGLTIGSGPSGWTMPAIVGCLTGLVLGGGFLWVEQRLGNRAMMPLVMFASRTFAGLTLLTWLLYGALGALMVLVPYVLIEVAHYSGTGAGSALLPFAVTLALASPVTGGIAQRIGPRMPLILGSLGVAVGFLLLLRVSDHADYWSEVFPGILVLSLGMAGAVAPLTTAVLSSVDAHHSGSASGFNSAVARTAGMMATALLGGVLGASGDALLKEFHAAVIVCAGVCVAASASVFLLIPAKAEAQG